MVCFGFIEEFRTSGSRAQLLRSLRLPPNGLLRLLPLPNQGRSHTAELVSIIVFVVVNAEQGSCAAGIIVIILLGRSIYVKKV